MEFVIASSRYKQVDGNRQCRYKVRENIKYAFKSLNLTSCPSNVGTKLYILYCRVLSCLDSVVNGMSKIVENVEKKARTVENNMFQVSNQITLMK